jgi:N-methylhydantoinase A
MSAASGRRVSAREAARGVVRVVNTNMERALRVISVERGYDPREFALLPFGGAGGLHAVELARALRIPRVIAPLSAGALSATGALISDVVKDWSRTVMLEGVKDSYAKIEEAFREMEQEARATLRLEGFRDARQRHERSLAVRYHGQSFELEIKWGRGGGGGGSGSGDGSERLAKAFHQAHRARYGYAQEANHVEVVSARLRSTGLVEKSRVAHVRRSSGKARAAATREFATVYFTEKQSRAHLYNRDELYAGTSLLTPCIVREYSATTLIPPGARAVVDEHGNLIIEP